MADILSEESVLNWSVRQAHRYTGFSRDVIAKRIEAAALIPAGERSGNAVYASRELLPILYKTSIYSAAASDPDKLPPRERRDWYEGERVRIKLAIEQKELVSIAEYREELASILKALANFLETLPDVLERKAGLSPAQIESMFRLIDAQRTALAERLTARADPEAGD